MGKMSRTKGAAGERQVIHILREHGWHDARRSSDGRVQRGRGDIIGGPEGTHIECKRVERLNVPQALRQIEADANPLDVPMLVHRSSRQPWLCTMNLEDVLPLLRMRES